MKTLVILHGWGHSAEMWRDFAYKFSDIKVVLLDLPGFRREKLVNKEWDVSEYANWVYKKLKSKKVKSAFVLGHSFGGKVATEMAIGHPEMVEKLILVSAPVLRRPTLTTKLKILLHKISKKVVLRNALLTITNDEYKDAKNNDMGRIFVKSVEYDAGEKLAEIKVPTLIIWGDKDIDAPLFIGKEMNEMISESRLEILKNTGHNIHIENPYLMYGLVKSFIYEKDN